MKKHILDQQQLEIWLSLGESQRGYGWDLRPVDGIAR